MAAPDAPSAPGRFDEGGALERKRGTTRPKIVIIGAGIVGASIAYNLSLRNADVTVVDAGRPGMAASHASYAWINARPKPPRSYHDLNLSL